MTALLVLWLSVCPGGCVDQRIYVDDMLAARYAYETTTASLTACRRMLSVRTSTAPAPATSPVHLPEREDLLWHPVVMGGIGVIVGLVVGLLVAR